MSWLRVTSAAEYMDLSTKSVRRLIKQGLEVSRLPSGTILIHQEIIDEFLTKYSAKQNDLKTVVDEIMAEF